MTYKELARQIAKESILKRANCKSAFFSSLLAPISSVLVLLGIFKLFENFGYLSSYLHPQRFLAGLLPEEKILAHKYLSKGFSPLFSADQAKREATLFHGGYGEVPNIAKYLTPYTRQDIYDALESRKQAIEGLTTYPRFKNEILDIIKQDIRDKELIAETLNKIVDRIEKLESNLSSDLPTAS